MCAYRLVISELIIMFSQEDTRRLNSYSIPDFYSEMKRSSITREGSFIHQNICNQKPHDEVTFFCGLV